MEPFEQGGDIRVADHLSGEDGKAVLHDPPGRQRGRRVGGMEGQAIGSVLDFQGRPGTPAVALAQGVGDDDAAEAVEGDGGHLAIWYWQTGFWQCCAMRIRLPVMTDRLVAWAGSDAMPSGRERMTLIPADMDPFTPEQIIHLDAEDLAEGCIPYAYQAVAQALQGHGVDLLDINDQGDGSYVIGEWRYWSFPVTVDAPPSSGMSWDYAAWIFFRMVNAQLEGRPVKLYALNVGNDLDGVILTEEEARGVWAVRRSGVRWNLPYFPTRGWGD
jgi:hypothetical protein